MLSPRMLPRLKCPVSNRTAKHNEAALAVISPSDSLDVHSFARDMSSSSSLSAAKHVPPPSYPDVVIEQASVQENSHNESSITGSIGENNVQDDDDMVDVNIVEIKEGGAQREASSGSFIELEMNEIDCAWRWKISKQLLTRNKAEFLPFADLPEYHPPRRTLEPPEDDEDEAHTMKERLLDLETRLHKRTKMSRRHIRMLGVSLATVVIVAIVMGVRFGFAMLSSGGVDACARQFSITSLESLSAFASLGCPRVTSLTINGSLLDGGPMSVVFPALATVTDAFVIAAWRSNASSVSFPALTHAGTFIISDVKLLSANFPALATIDDFAAERLTLTGGVNFPSLVYASSIAVNDAYTLSINFPVLESVLGNFTLHAARSYGDIIFPSLRSVGMMDIEGPLRVVETAAGGNPVTLKCVALRRLRGFALANLIGVLEIGFPNLKDVQWFSMVSVSFSQYLNLNFVSPISKGNIDLSGLERASYMVFRSVFGMPILNFANLQKAESLLFDGNTVLQTVRCPALQQVGDVCFTSNTNVNNVSFPVLKTAIQGFRFLNNPALVSVTAPSLTAGILQFTLNTALHDISFPAMTRGSIVVGANPMLASVHFPLVASLGIASFFRNTVLSTICLPKLRHLSQAGWLLPAGPSTLFWVIAQSDILGKFNVSLTPGTQLLNVGGALVGGSFSAFDNANLSKIDMGSWLQNAQAILINNNPRLCPSNIRFPSTIEVVCGCTFEDNGVSDHMCDKSAPVGGVSFSCPVPSADCKFRGESITDTSTLPI
eukprot:Opistho-2@81022